MLDDKTKNEIVEQVIKELKEKKLFGVTKTSFKSAEKMLYSLNVLPEAILSIKDEIKQLEKENQKITKNIKSPTLVLKGTTYNHGDETLEARISELKQIVVKAESQIRLVNSALNKIKDEEYYDIIPLYYFENKTIPEIAEELDCANSTISKYKKKLMNKLKVYMFPNTFIDEL